MNTARNDNLRPGLPSSHAVVLTLAEEMNAQLDRLVREHETLLGLIVDPSDVLALALLARRCSVRTDNR